MPLLKSRLHGRLQKFGANLAHAARRAAPVVLAAGAVGAGTRGRGQETRPVHGADRGGAAEAREIAQGAALRGKRERERGEKMIKRSHLHVRVQKFGANLRDLGAKAGSLVDKGAHAAHGALQHVDPMRRGEVRGPCGRAGREGRQGRSGGLREGERSREGEEGIREGLEEKAERRQGMASIQEAVL